MDSPSSPQVGVPEEQSAETVLLRELSGHRVDFSPPKLGTGARACLLVAGVLFVICLFAVIGGLVFVISVHSSEIRALKAKLEEHDRLLKILAKTNAADYDYDYDVSAVSSASKRVGWSRPSEDLLSQKETKNVQNGTEADDVDRDRRSDTADSANRKSRNNKGVTQGPQGPRGLPGPQGSVGPQGPPGPPGLFSTTTHQPPQTATKTINVQDSAAFGNVAAHFYAYLPPHDPKEIERNGEVHVDYGIISGESDFRAKGGYYRYWKETEWTRKLLNKRPFCRLNANGNITIQEAGIYFIYSQLTFRSSAVKESYDIFINGQAIARCTHQPHYVDPGANPTLNQKSNACYMGVSTLLKKGDQVALRHGYRNRLVEYWKETSYFGLVKLFHIDEDSDMLPTSRIYGSHTTR